MKIFKSWKELNKPRWTSFGGIGWCAYGAYLFTDGTLQFFNGLIVLIVIGIWFIRELTPNETRIY